jgi:5'-methylthioinosine phosphorylase
VGMTAMPEAALTRERGLEYAVCAVAVNYAAGRSPDGASIRGQIERFMDAGSRKIRAVLERLVAGMTNAV